MGSSTARSHASATSGSALTTPSATSPTDATASSRFAPLPIAIPTRRFRERSDVHVATRSPTPARPPKVSAVPPSATPRRPISASPLVMIVARVLSPNPSPSETPAAIASTFFVAPATSHP